MLEHYKNKFTKFLFCGKNLNKFNFLKVIIVYIFFIQTFIVVSFFHSYLLYIADESQADKVLYEKDKSFALQENSCTPIKKIGFLKTHKTASSTVQNILLRYGYINKLNFVFGRQGTFTQLGDLSSNFDLKYFRNVKTYEMPWHNHLLRTDGYDICAIHMRWNKTAVSHLLQPKSYYHLDSHDDGDKGNALYFTILREPSSVFESLYGYYDLAQSSVLNMNIHQYIETLNTLDGSLDYPLLYRNNTQMGLNQQLYDMGIKEIDSFNAAVAQKEIDRLKNEFDFVMIAEMLEESLVLLAQHLCWPLEWVAYISHNVRKPDTKALLSEKEKSILSQYQQGDELLYKEFKNILSKKVEVYGKEKIKEDIKTLRKINANISKSCKLKSNVNEIIKFGHEYNPTSSQVYGYKPKSNDMQCKLISMGEIQALKFLRRIQKKRFRQIIGSKKAVTN